MEHTPSPWTIQETRDGLLIDPPDNSNGGYTIAELYGSRRLANAKLIKASPDLLKAAKYALKVYQGHARHKPISTGMEKALVDLKEAIAMAENKQ